MNTTTIGSQVTLGGKVGVILELKRGSYATRAKILQGSDIAWWVLPAELDPWRVQKGKNLNKKKKR
jgi:hypothetical protein